MRYAFFTWAILNALWATTGFFKAAESVVCAFEMQRSPLLGAIGGFCGLGVFWGSLISMFYLVRLLDERQARHVAKPDDFSGADG